MSTTAFGYCRVSTAEQYESTLGVRAYVANIIRYAEAKGLDLGPPRKVAIGDEVFDSRERIVIEHVSAFKTRFFDRKGAKAIIQGIEDGTHLIFAKVDRAFRSQRDNFETVNRLREAGVKLHFLDLQGIDLDISCGIGAIILQFLGWAAQAESERISERVLAAKREAKLRGRPSNHTPPVGFKWVGHGAARKMVLDPEQVALLRQFAVWVKERKGERTIMKELRRLGVKIPYRAEYVQAKFGNEWSVKAIRRYKATAKRMEEILRDKQLMPEDGDAWLQEYHKRATAKDAEKAARREKRMAEVARNRLKGKA